MTPHGQTIFRKAFNYALKSKGDEESAFAIANAAVNKAGERKKSESEMSFAGLVEEVAGGSGMTYDQKSMIDRAHYMLGMKFNKKCFDRFVPSPELGEGWFKGPIGDVGFIGISPEGYMMEVKPGE